ncbi:MAG: anti-sigma factor antagonist [Clostridia bacterium]|nr:anti-sigma factor antagonist [Clostridia bacterium]
MQVLFRTEKEKLTVYLSGDIDHHTSAQIRQSVDEQLQKFMPKELRLDFRDVHFMDSSGVGLVMGRYKAASVYGCKVVVCSMPDNVARIMKMSGLSKIITFDED